MTRAEKSQKIDELFEDFKNNNFFYMADASGMSVAETNNFRRICHQRGIKYYVVKNTLIKKALDKMETDYTPFDEEVLRGFTGVMFSEENGSLPAKIIKEFRKKIGREKPLLKGASIDTDLFIGDNQLDALSKLKSKEELIAEVISLLQSPAKNVISALQSGEHKLAGLVKTLSERES